MISILFLVKQWVFCGLKTQFKQNSSQKNTKPTDGPTFLENHIGFFLGYHMGITCAKGDCKWNLNEDNCKWNLKLKQEWFQKSLSNRKQAWAAALIAMYLLKWKQIYSFIIRGPCYTWMLNWMLNSWYTTMGQ